MIVRDPGPIASAFVFALCCFGATPVDAMMDTFARSATSSSIPCAGVLTEASGGGSVGGNSSESVTLTCRVGERVAWLLEAAADCGSASEGMPATFCEGPKAKPVYQFNKSATRDGKQEYHLYRYLFAKECLPVKSSKRLLEPVSNKARASFQVPGYLCKNVSVVDGTQGAAGSSLPPIAWRSAVVVTNGPPMGSGAAVDAPAVFGVDASEYTYQVSWPSP